MATERGTGGFLVTIGLLVVTTTLGAGCRDGTPQRSDVQGARAAVVGGDGACSTALMNIVAHEDDDLLFLSPDLARSVQSADTCVRTVFLTAGDDGSDESYWGQREAGARAAYAQMMGVANEWTASDAGVAGHTLSLLALAAAPRVSLVFVRLPDGLTDGSGFELDHFESMQKLWEGGISVIHTVDGANSYDASGLTDALASLIAAFRPTAIRTQDFTASYNDGDHSDHITAALFARAAQTRDTPAHACAGYQDYGTKLLPANVAGADLDAKWAAFLAYAAFDPRVCQDRDSCAGSEYEQWMQRQYQVGTGAGNGEPLDPPGAAGPPDAGAPPGTTDGSSEINFALSAHLEASSETPAYGQIAAKAADGFIDGYPGNYTREWATQGGGAGSWLQATWAAPVLISRVVLFDRPNAADQILSAILQLSDGSAISLGALPNDGTPLEITWPTPVTISSLTLRITGVSATTLNIGLSELQAWGPASGAGSGAPSDSGAPSIDGGVSVEAGADSGAVDAGAPAASINLAPLAAVTASSETPAYGQTADKAVDGVIDGYPHDYTREWATMGGGAGSWLTLTWPQPVTLSRIVLYDRPNAADQITAGTLRLSDGTAIALGPLPNDGSPLEVDLSSVSVSSVSLLITAVAPTTENIGLSEIEAWGSL